MKYESVYEDEFSRACKAGTFARVFLKESSTELLKFHVVGVDNNGLPYFIKHRRKNEYRAWRLDNAAKFLKKLGVKTFTTQFIINDGG